MNQTILRAAVVGTVLISQPLMPAFAYFHGGGGGRDFSRSGS